LARVSAANVKIESRVVTSAATGEPAHLGFRLTVADTGRPYTEAKDVLILMMGPMWQRRQVAAHRGDGIYSVDFAVPTPGVYNVFLGAPSLGLSYAKYATVEVKGQDN
jgi:hypothetical protein